MSSYSTLDQRLAVSDSILVERRQGAVWVTLNRPATRNAMNERMVEELARPFEALPDDSDARFLVLRGGGADLSCGGELKDISHVLEKSDVGGVCRDRTSAA